MESGLHKALQILKRDTYCLWIGAGVSVQLGSVGGCSVPLWKDLVEEMESTAGIKRPPFETDYPTRIEVCLRHLKRPRFQSFLREAILHRLAKAILAGQDIYKSQLPEQARQLAHLGTKANPIVNFNVESLTSQAIAGPGGPWRVLPFNSMQGLGGGRKSESSQKFERHIYHPHGVIDVTGHCVVASSEYHSLSDTLALQLAVHSAFGLNLAIVGMSLEDVYLREQLETFRGQISRVFMFTDVAVSGATARWAWKNDVTVVESPWDEFWKSTAQVLPGPDEVRLHSSWLMLLMAASGSCGTPTVDAIKGFLKLGDKLEELDEWIASAKSKGEKVELHSDASIRSSLPGGSMEFFKFVANFKARHRKSIGGTG